MSERPETPLLDQVNAPADLKRLSDDELHQLAAELRAIRLAAIEDQIDAAEERGRESVHLMVEDARWLVNKVRGE